MLEYNKCSLRPLDEKDLRQVLTWRNSDRIRNLMFTDHQISWEEHVAWYQRVRDGRTNSLHFVFSYDGQILGQVNVSQIDTINQRCYWGFFIGDETAPAGSGMAMGFLALQHIFEELKMHKLCSEALAFNAGSIKYHKKLGFAEEGYFKEHVRKNGKLEDIVCLAYFADCWYQQKNTLFKQCFEVNL